MRCNDAHISNAPFSISSTPLPRVTVILTVRVVKVNTFLGVQIQSHIGAEAAGMWGDPCKFYHLAWQMNLRQYHHPSMNHGSKSAVGRSRMCNETQVVVETHAEFQSNEIID